MNNNLNGKHQISLQRQHAPPCYAMRNAKDVAFVNIESIVFDSGWRTDISPN